MKIVWTFFPLLLTIACCRNAERAANTVGVAASAIIADNAESLRASIASEQTTRNYQLAIGMRDLKEITHPAYRFAWGGHIGGFYAYLMEQISPSGYLLTTTVVQGNANIPAIAGMTKRTVRVWDEQRRTYDTFSIGELIKPVGKAGWDHFVRLLAASNYLTSENLTTYDPALIGDSWILESKALNPPDTGTVLRYNITRISGRLNGRLTDVCGYLEKLSGVSIPSSHWHQQQ